jgi:tetratricopeptide (TPR) repeat protein
LKLTGWQISLGSLAELIAPLSFTLAALLSAWVFYDARRRGLKLPAVVSWTLTTLLFTPVVFPLYLFSLLFDRTRPHAEAHAASPETPCDAVSEPDAAIQDAQTRRRFVLPLLYLSVLLLPGALYFYSDYRSVDAHLARAEQAKLRERRAQAIGEYRAALALEDDPHTRKLLGIELAREGRMEEALVEFLAAERAGEPDDLLAFRIASALDALGRTNEAGVAYRKFLSSRACASSDSPDDNCEPARLRLGQLQSAPETS